MMAQILDGKRSGLGLPESDRNTLTLLQKELSQVCLEFDVSSNGIDLKGVLNI